MGLYYCKTCGQFFGPMPFCGCESNASGARIESVSPAPEVPLEYREAFEEYEREYE